MVFVIVKAVFNNTFKEIAVFFGEGRQAFAAVTNLNDFPTIGEGRALDAFVVGAFHDFAIGDAVTVERLTVVIDDPSEGSDLSFGGVGHHLIK